MSIATAQWEQIDARQAIYECVDELNGIGGGFDINKDLVLKACLVLTDVSDIGFRVRNFTRENTGAIEERWVEISDALRVAVRIVERFGYSGHTLTAKNVLIPLAYYVYARGFSEENILRPDFADDAGKIRKWVRCALIKRGTFGAGLDTTLRAARETIREKCMQGFSFREMESAFAKIGRPLRFEEEELDDLLDQKYGSPLAFSVLSMLYPYIDFTNQFHIDHIFPQSQFSLRRLRKPNIKEEDIPEYRDRYDRVGNLQLLAGPENLAKGDMMPADWIRDVGDRKAWYGRNYVDEIPNDLSGFLAFYEDRRGRMKRRLAQVLGVSLVNGSADLDANVGEA